MLFTLSFVRPTSRRKDNPQKDFSHGTEKIIRKNNTARFILPSFTLCFLVSLGPRSPAFHPPRRWTSSALPAFALRLQRAARRPAAGAAGGGRPGGAAAAAGDAGKTKMWNKVARRVCFSWKCLFLVVFVCFVCFFWVLVVVVFWFWVVLVGFVDGLSLICLLLEFGVWLFVISWNAGGGGGGEGGEAYHLSSG